MMMKLSISSSSSSFLCCCSSSSSSSSSSSFPFGRLSSSSHSPPPLVRRPLVTTSPAPPLRPRLPPPPPSPHDNTSTVDIDELDVFLELLPEKMRKKKELLGHPELRDLVEVVMDLGRKPLARFPSSGDWIISDDPVGSDDLHHALSRLSLAGFSDDNRSGIDRSLHRISAIRNRKMDIVGLTCRVGRAVSGSAHFIRDLLHSGSILVIGPPGVGKTTLIREIARLLADEHMKRVVIVDTSNEIGGDGDIPHPGIGRARRMQVPSVSMQHNVMIEAVENHMPEVIIIDEIGTELEAMAASTIAQRGVQLVGTAHGVTIESIMKNPSLQILVGGIESVTLGDEEARKRKVQKTILERKGPPVFACVVEMISKTECRVHHKLEHTVDALLAGKTPRFEVRHMDMDFVGPVPEHTPRVSPFTFNGHEDVQAKDIDVASGTDFRGTKSGNKSSDRKYNRLADKDSPVRVYLFKIEEVDLLQVAEAMGLESKIDVTDDIGTADAILAVNYELKQYPWIRTVAKFHKLPIFVIKKNTMAKMMKAVRMILNANGLGPLPIMPENQRAGDIEIEDDAPKRKPSVEEIDALEEVRMAIEYIVIPGGEPVELLPRCSEIIARQLELVESYQLKAEKSGTESNSRLQILPQKLSRRKEPSVKRMASNQKSSPTSNVPPQGSNGRDGGPRVQDEGSNDRDGGGPRDEGPRVTRLPLLPEW